MPNALCSYCFWSLQSYLSLFYINKFPPLVTSTCVAEASCSTHVAKQLCNGRLDAWLCQQVCCWIKRPVHILRQKWIKSTELASSVQYSPLLSRRCERALIGLYEVIYTWGIWTLSETCFLGPTQVSPKWHLDQFSCFIVHRCKTANALEFRGQPPKISSWSLEHLNFSDQITSLSKGCYYHIRQLRCTRLYRDSSTACTIATSVVRRRPYIHTCRSYVHTPCERDRHTITVRLPTLNFTSGWVADSSDFGLLGSKVPQNGRFCAPEAHEPPCKIWRR